MLALLPRSFLYSNPIEGPRYRRRVWTPPISSTIGCSRTDVKFAWVESSSKRWFFSLQLDHRNVIMNSITEIRKYVTINCRSIRWWSWDYAYDSKRIELNWIVSLLFSSMLSETDRRDAFVGWETRDVQFRRLTAPPLRVVQRKVSKKYHLLCC